ncbi:hypothetical protein BDZ94DRAFT_177029 [Collybia nuda]|uniref:Zn(2)-C6 fungal-type domain-containing protein n=1 Tax=Collybia nuda TaxID=64659 RepID=A0A9P5YDM3_9AGAR|nr:hypothetical protein BDZ94DRAFT_177029 [Collybia nuda]
MSLSTTKSASPPLQRGKACGNCRRRKIRCDGNRPICGPCGRTAKSAEDCEYTDTGRSRTQLLEANIVRLEARVRELESLDHRTPVALVTPYEEPRPSPPSILLSGANSPSPYSSPNNPDSLSPITPPSSSSSIEPTSEEPSLVVIKLLLQSFLPHASEFGFFLDTSRFCENALRPLPIGHHNRPAPALLSATYLWGVHLSQSDALAAHERVFLSRALQHSASNLTTDHPLKILHGLQAEILLSLYFFQANRLMEGRYHYSAAISIIMSTRMHKIRSMQDSQILPCLSFRDRALLPHPIDMIEEGEQILGFWTTYALHNCWSVALGSPMPLGFDAHGTQVDTPWPLDVNQYGHLPPDLQGSFTVQNFLNNSSINSFGEFSTLAMYAKASILFERAAYKATQCYPDMPPNEAAVFTSSFTSLNGSITRFIADLPPISQLEMTLPAVIRTIFVTHTLAHSACLHLHAIFAESDSRSRDKCVASALAIMGLIGDVDLQSFQHINPILGALWMAACQFLIDEIFRLKTLRSIWGPEGPSEEKENRSVTALERGFGALAMFSLECPLFSYQLTKIQEAYSQLHQ